MKFPSSRYRVGRGRRCAGRKSGIGRSAISYPAADECLSAVKDFIERIEDPTTGNWTQQDTLNAPLDAANGDRYTYATNNPTNNTDPTGLDNVDNAFDIASGVAGVVAGGCTIGSASSAAGVITSPGAVPLAACAGVAAGTAAVFQGVKAIYDGISGFFD